VIRAALLVAIMGVLLAANPVPKSRTTHDGAELRDIHEIRIRVAGGTVRALCTDGPRQVVLLHGASDVADTWRSVLERMPSEVGACAYDRLGNGNSVPRPDERGWYEFLDEVRNIHRALSFESPYVLVGHALGGLYGRLYAIDRPGDVRGLVLVDPAHEDMLGRARPGMPDAEWKEANGLRDVPNEDGIVVSQLDARLRRGRLPDIPVTVITAGTRREDGGWDARFVNEAARQVHASILSGISVARHVPASRSGPAVQRDEPRLVADEILRVVRSTRR